MEAAPMKETPPAAGAHDIAVRIYVDLVSRHAQLADGALKMPVSAKALAEASVRWAEVFLKTEADITAASGPAKDYKLDGDDIASWSKA